MGTSSVFRSRIPNSHMPRYRQPQVEEADMQIKA